MALPELYAFNEWKKESDLSKQMSPTGCDSFRRQQMDMAAVKSKL